jgi:hypothetical protein
MWEKQEDKSYGKIMQLELDDDKEDMFPDLICANLCILDNRDGKIPFYTMCHHGSFTSMHISLKEDTTQSFGTFAGWTQHAASGLVELVPAKVVIRMPRVSLHPK